MSDILNIDILANVNVDNLKEAKSVVTQIVTEAKQLSAAMNQVEGSTGLFTRQLDGCRSSAELLGKSIDSFKDGVSNGEIAGDEVQQRLDRIRDMAEDLKAMSGLVFDGGKFSANAAHGLLDSLPKEISKRFNEIAPRIMAMINGKMNGINLKTNMKMFEGVEFKEARALLDNVFAGSGNDKYAAKYKSRLTKLLVQNANPIYSTGEYHQLRYGKDWQRVFNSSKYEFQHKEDLLPQLYAGIFKDKSFKPFRANSGNLSDTLDSAPQKDFIRLLKTNRFAREAAIQAGIATRNGDYIHFNGAQSKESVGKMATALYEMFDKRVRGLSSGDLGVINDLNDPLNERRIVARMSNGSGSQILSAMNAVSDILTNEHVNFTQSKKLLNPAVVKERDRLKEMYAIPEYGFAGKRNKMVTISESQLTDLLGFSGSDYTAHNEVAELNLSKYDYNDAGQRKELLDIIKNGVHNGDYQFHSFHGTGENLKARFIRREAAERLNERYKSFAEKYGFAGTDILHSFMPTENLTAEEFGKAQDEFGKIWSDGVKTNKSLKNKTFAAVDFSALKDGKWSEFVDGMNIMMDTVIDDPSQTRFALGVKGSNNVISGFRNFGEWAEKAGFITSGKRIYLPGLRAKENQTFDYAAALRGDIDDETAKKMIAAGQLTDVTDINGGLISASTIKNKAAYMTDKLRSSDKTNEALTALTRLTGIRTLANYEEENTSVSSLGPQASAFLSLSGITKKAQEKYVNNVLNSLDTVEGIRKYVFANETDEISRRVNDPNGDPGIINNPAVQKRVALFRESFLNKVLTGDIFNTEDKTITMAKGRTLKNPLSVMLGLVDGKLSDEQYQKYNEIMKENGRDYTKEELEDLINLKDAAVNFELADKADKLKLKSQDMAIMRSPSAYGALVVRRNVAKEIAPLFKALGFSTAGTYLNDQDLKTLQGADLDGDTVKMFIGSIINDAKKTMKNYQGAVGDGFKTGELITEDVGDIEGGWSFSNPLALLEIAKRSKDATYGMARAANIGTRLQQFNLNDPSYGILATIAANANPLYDFYTTYQKKMKNIIDMSNRSIAGPEAGNEFAKLPVRLGNMFDINKFVEDGQVVMRNGQGDIVNGVEDNKGRLINIDALKELNIDAFNMPSMYNDASIMAMMRSKSAYNRGYGNKDYTDELTHIFTEMLDYNGFEGTSVGNLMRNMRKIRAEFLSGSRFGISKEEEDVLSKQLIQAESQIDEMAKDRKFSPINPETGKEFKGDQMRRYYMRKAGIYQAQMLLGRYLLDAGNGKKIMVGEGYTDDERKNYLSGNERDFLAQSGISLDNTIVGEMSESEFDAYLQREEDRKKLMLKEKEDKKRLAGVRYIDPDLIADDGTVMARERNGKVVPLKDHKYHFSELHSAMASPSEWFDVYMGNKKVFNQSIALGNAVHKTMEGLFEPYVGVANTVDKFFDLDTAKNIFEDRLNKEYKNYGFTEDGARGDMIKRARKFISGLGGILKGESIVGTEAGISGYMDTDKYGKLQYTGNYDLLTRDSSGNLILSDFKPRKSYGADHPEHTVTGSSVGDQLYLYAYAYNEREKQQNGKKANLINKLRVLGYGDSTDTDAEKSIARSTFDYDEDMAKRVYERYSKEAELVRTVRANATNKEDALRMFNTLPVAMNELNHAIKIDEAEADIKEKKQLVIDQVSGVVAKLEKGSIGDIANQFQLKDKVEAYEKELYGIEGNILKRGDFRNEGKRPNFWEGINYALTNGFEDQIGELKAHGLSDAEENLMRARRNKIYEEFSDRRDSASHNDFVSFRDLVTKQIDEDSLSGQLKNYIKLAEQLESEFQKAAEARDSLINEKNNIENRIKSNNTQDGDQRRLDDINNLLKLADEEEVAAKETKKQREDLLKDKAKKSLTGDLNTLFSSYTGVNNPVLSVDNQVASLINNKNAILASIEEARYRGIINDDTYNSMYVKANAMNPDQYRERLNNNLLDTSTRQIDRTLESMGSISMNRNYRYRRDVWSRAQFNALSEYKSRQQMQDQMQKELDNAVSIKNGFAESKDTDKYNEAAANVERLTAAMADNERQMSSLRSISGMLNKTIEELGYNVSQVVARFGRQMFQRAIQEAKRFIVSFDTAMSQIQTITMKSDEEMQTVRKQTVDKAIELHTSVANVSDVEAALYRQGLSDSEVSSRTDSIIKFATVTGVKAIDATKALTAAVKSGLVSSVDEAMDAMSALGDNAATTAQEIFKGMQKSVGAAKQANMSFAELTALLTIGTEKTQLGGTQVGTAINTMLQRMQRVTTDKYVTDEDGNTTDINNVESALRLAGVNLRDDTGNFRRGFDVLRDLATNWNNLNSLQRSNVTYAMAGTRANIFQNLMEGMGEDGGATLDEYLGLAENSQGITDKKYDIYIQNIASSIETLKSAFDGFIESLEGNGLITGVIDGITSILQGLSNFASESGKIVTALSVVGTAVVAFAAKLIILNALKNNPIANPVASITSLAVGAIGLGAMSFIGKSVDKNKTTSSSDEITERIQTKKEYADEKYNVYKDIISDMESLRDKATKDYDDSLVDKFNRDVVELSTKFPELSKYLIDSTSSIESWTNAIDKSKEVVDNNDVKNRQSAEIELPALIDSVTSEYDNSKKDIYSNIVFDEYNGDFARYILAKSERFDGTARYSVDDNALYLRNPYGEYSIDDLNYDKYDLKENVSGLIRSSFYKGTNMKLRSTLDDLINDFISSHNTGYYEYNGKTYSSANDIYDEYKSYSGEKDDDFFDALTDALFMSFAGDGSFYKKIEVSKNENYDLIQKAVDVLFLNIASVISGIDIDSENYIKETLASLMTLDENRYEVGSFVDELLGYKNNDYSFNNEKFQKDNEIDKDIPEYYYLNKDGSLSDYISREDYFDRVPFFIEYDSINDLGRSANRSEYLGYQNKYLEKWQDMEKLPIVDQNGNRFKIDENGDFVPLTTVGDVVSSVGLSNKDKGFKNEYRNLASQIANGNDIVDFLAADSEGFTNLSPMLQADSVLTEMLQSIYNNTGEYNDETLLRYLQEKAYGSTYQDAYKSVGSLTSDIREGRSLLAQYYSGDGVISNEVASKIANSLGIDLDTFYSNADFYRSQYEDQLAYNERTALNTVDSDMYARTSQYAEATFNADDYDDYMSKLREAMSSEEFERFNELIESYKNIGIEFDYDGSGLKAAIGDLDDFADLTDNAKNLMLQLRGSAKDTSAALKAFGGVATDAADNQFFREKYKAGDRSKETLTAISKMTNIGQDALKTMNMEDILPILNLSETADLQDVNDWAAGFNEQLALAVQGALDAGAINVPVNGGIVNLDFGAVFAALTAQGLDAVNGCIAILQSIYAQGQLNVETDAEGKVVTASFDVTSLGKGRSSSGKSGGGGGGKSKSAKLIEELKREKELLDHRVKMVRYQETKYQNADELGNYGRMLEVENEVQEDLRRIITENITKLEDQMTKVKKGSDDWYDLRKAVMEYEEELEDINNTIAENTKKLKENEQAILKLHTDLEDAIREEIETRIQDERDMLDGTVSIEDIILDAIRNRYQVEWDMLKLDIEKKRKALDEEKSMIDERLKRRKEAEDEAEKYEKLAEYRRQYAAISADSTRTKDAAELRKKIADLEKDIGWDIAEDEANTQKKIIEDQLKGYDEFVENGDEDLEAFLKDANNFAVEVTDILGSSHDDLMEWLKGNIEDYGYSLDEQKQKTLNEWEDMYKQMLGIVDTYWEQIAATLTDKDVFLNYLKMSKSYINASADEQAQMLYQWGDMFDKWTLAQKRDAEYSHTDEGLENTDKVTYGSGGGSKTTTTSYNNGGVSESNVKALQSYLGVTADGKFGPATLAAAKAKFGSGITDAASAWAAYVNKNKTSSATIGSSGIKSSVNKNVMSAYATGGYVDYTGLAWVDGTKTKPEAFLNANDTALLRGMLDAASMLSIKPFISNVDSGSFNSTSSNVGEVNITINQAELKDDADFEEVAKKVGESFIKELNKTGLTSVRFSF